MPSYPGGPGSAPAAHRNRSCGGNQTKAVCRQGRKCFLRCCSASYATNLTRNRRSGAEAASISLTRLLRRFGTYVHARTHEHRRAGRVYVSGSCRDPQTPSLAAKPRVRGRSCEPLSQWDRSAKHRLGCGCALCSGSIFGLCKDIPVRRAPLLVISTSGRTRRKECAGGAADPPFAHLLAALLWLSGPPRLLPPIATRG